MSKSFTYYLGVESANLKHGVLTTKHAKFNAPEVPEVSEQAAKSVGSKLNINFKKYPFDQFRSGMQAEFEHTSNPAQAGKISLDHLKESPRYYTELKKMENKLKREGQSRDHGGRATCLSQC